MVPKERQNGKLEDKIAIVTGAGRGIGESIAAAMAEEGARVAVVEVSDQRCKETTDKIIKMGGQAMSLKVDVAVWMEVEEAVSTVISRFGRVDILINNAGIGQIENFLDGDRKRWERIIAVDLMGVAFFSRAVLHDMVKRKAGKIVNISSNAGIFPCARQVIYSAAKGGVVSFTKSLASEMAPYHINVNAICPGSVETPLYMKAHDLLPDHLKPYQRKMQDDIPWGRLASPEEIARLAVFLTSDESKYITGQCISIDGGASHYPNISTEYPYVS
jgi:2-hydroxycyclohexanecarboxyl-CoA dehydrogenase